MKKTFDVFLLPEVVQELRKRGVMNVAKIYTDPVVPGSKKSRYGYEGDNWYIPEHGKFVDDRENIMVFPDGGARKKSGGIGIDLLTAPVSYDDCQILVGASRMPRWAARTWVEITAVQYPKRVQSLTEVEILSLGFNETDEGFTIGDLELRGATDIVHMFSTWWNENMGGWRVIKSKGVPSKCVSYPFMEGNVLREINHMGLERHEYTNPWVIIYSLKLL